MNMWAATIESARHHPLVGQGLGSSQDLIERLFGLAHPHNDYLRLWHDLGLVGLLLLVSVTGLMLLALRETAAMGVLLAAHLGAVMALFITLPYGKFVHAVYRFAALVRYHLERKRALPEMGAE